VTEEEDHSAEVSAWLAGVLNVTSSNGDGPKHGSLTDVTNASRLIRDHGQDLRYVALWNRWLRYDTGRWGNDETCQIETLAKNTIHRLLRDAIDILDPDLKKRAIKEIVASERSSRIEGMIRMARSDVALQPHQLDSDPWLFNVRNGTVDLRTGQLQPHNQADLLTKQAPVDYDPDAKAPAFQKFLEHVVPDSDVRHFLRRAIGYTLTGHTAEQILLILYGHGSNGKSTLIETILHMFGDYGQQSPPETFLEQRNSGIPNDVARLMGARFVSASEISDGRRLNESLVKRMTGGDTMTARFMRSEFFEFQPQFTPWISANHRPEIRGTDHAIWRRVKLVPFDIQIPDEEQDNTLKPRLRSELPGILAWAVRGCLDWQMDGLQEPEIVKAATAEYRGDMDVLGGFLEDRCLTAEGYSEASADLYRAYQDWTKTTGTEAIPARTFGLRLGERGLQQLRTHSGRHWTGIRLVRDQEDLGI
jgi:putative DNA primase/helicase